MFEAALIESTRQKVDTRRWMTLPLAIILHVVVIGSAVALSLWYIEEIPDPPIPVSFYVQAAPPPPPPPPPPPSNGGGGGGGGSMGLGGLALLGLAAFATRRRKWA